jgi:hypothetical protein
MKIVREYINEKFTEESDPVRDLGIGIINKLEKELKNESEYYKLFPKKDGTIECHKNMVIVVPRYVPVATVNQIILNEIIIAAHKLHFKVEIKPLHNRRTDKIFKFLITPISVREYINEKFSEEGDPIHDLGIGKRKIIFGEIWKPIFRDYTTKFGPTLILKETRNCFNLFKQQVEPIIIDHYVEGHTWTKDFAGETKFKVYRIMGKDGLSLFKNGLFHVEAEGKHSKYLERYTIYLHHPYIISGY